MYVILKKIYRNKFPMICAILFAGFMTGCSAKNALTAEEAIIQVKNSISYEDGVMEFTLPLDYLDGKDYDIEVTGQYDEGSPIKYLHEENAEKKWVCGNTYKIQLDQVDYTELQMMICIKSSEIAKESIDLLSYIPSLPSENETDAASQIITGRIVLEGNVLHVEEVEVVFREDTERVKELGLDEDDLISGYVILNPEIKEETYTLTDETTYTYTVLVETEDSEEVKRELYTSNKKDEFLEHLGPLNTYPLEEQKIPYYLEIKDGKVINITENFALTI